MVRTALPLQGSLVQSCPGTKIPHDTEVGGKKKISLGNIKQEENL